MNQDDIPEPDPQLAFIIRERLALGGWVMVQAQLDPESDQASNKTPKSPPLSLRT
jgi:hypothetical protein